VANKLTIGDIRKLSVLTRKLQKQPRTIMFQPLPLENQEYLTVFSDTGFKKEELDGYALRGALHIRHTRPIYSDNGQSIKELTPCHILLAESRSMQTVCRSTYAAELLSAAAATDSSLPLVVTLYEVRTGPLGTEQLTQLRDQWLNKESYIRISVISDAKTFFESLKATMFNTPSENSLSGHVLTKREMHDKGLVDNIIWADTRDMYADGLTKGSVPRDALIDVMSGKLLLRHNIETFTRRTARRTYLANKLLTRTEITWI